MNNIDIEVEFYKRNKGQLCGNKDHIIALYGQEGYDLIKSKVKPESKRVKPFAVYKREVWKLTEKQPLHLLENFERRGFTDYHVDHIKSIFKAFKEGWTIEQCANINNLQMLPYKENMRKGVK